jgi:LysR family transcriptional regulator for bpeEF and oprC
LDLLGALRTFIRVAESGSFSAVAREIGATQPAVSRQIAALEEHLGARLIQRTTRSLTLTEDGRDLLGHARRVLDAGEETEAAIGRRRTSPAGLVRLATPVTLGRLYVVPRLPRLLGRYPELSIELTMSDAQIDLVSHGVDLAIRAGEVADTSLVARRIGSAGARPDLLHRAARRLPRPYIRAALSL